MTSYEGNWLSEVYAWFAVHFNLFHDYGGQEFYKFVKHEQPGTGFWPTISIKIQTFVGKIWTDKGESGMDFMNLTGKMRHNTVSVL